MGEPEHAARALARVRGQWELIGEQDPLWGVLSVDDRRGGRWDVDEFFATGRQEVDELMGTIASLGVDIGHARCLDFGCGVGRVTQALADRFSECDGVDIAESMVDRAREFNRHGESVRYHHNARGDLRIFPSDSFDLVYTRIALMHSPPELSAQYIPEFIRVARPGGLVVFQLPSGTSPAWAERFRLPAGAYRAELQMEPPPRMMRSGSHHVVRVRVRNTSSETWSAADPHPGGHGGLRLGNHWLDRRGQRAVIQDDGRARLPRDLRPDEEALIELTVTAPTRPGLYWLELDMVQEYVTWFAAHGSPTTRFRLIVMPALRRSASPTVIPEHTAYEMHWLPKERVLSLIEGAGARLLTTVEEDVLGYHDVFYYVLKPLG
jgi:SAM-dependent methyltransferase